MTIIIPDPPGQPSFTPGGSRELEMNRKNSRAFILADPMSLVLHRVTRVRSGDGGYTDTRLPLPGQIFRLIPQQDSVEDVKTPSGRIVKPRFVIMGEWNCDLLRNDMFEIGSIWYEVISPIRPEHTDNGYDKKGDVARRE